MSFINSTGLRCLLCFSHSGYSIQPKNNYLPLLTPQQIITSCSKHLTQEFIDASVNVIWKNANSVEGSFCQECYDISENLINLNIHMEKIQKDIAELGFRWIDRISKERRNYSLSVSTNIFDLSTSNINTNISNCNFEPQIQIPLQNTKNPNNPLPSNQSDSNELFLEDASLASSADGGFDCQLPQQKQINIPHADNNNKNSNLRKKHISKMGVSDSKKPDAEEKSTVTTSSDLQRHIEKGVVSCFECDKCHKKFSRLTILQRHDCSKPTCECEVCGKSFSGTGVLKLHMRSHTGEKPYKCDTCGKCYSIKCHLTTHIRTHTGERPYKCEHCGMGFIEISSYKNHLRKHQSIEDSKYKCELCSKTMKTYRSLRNHLLAHKGDTPHQCDKCGKGFSVRKNLLKHQKIHLEDRDRPFKCEVCGKGMVDKSSLVSHMVTHTTERKFLCDECARGFRSKGELERHLLEHKEQGPFICDTCGALFPTSSKLKVHVKNSHSERKLTCETCGKSFLYKSVLTEHIRSAHTSGKTFKCGKCKETFKGKRSLKNHEVLVHTDEDKRPAFPCEVCQKIFYNRQSLRNHQTRVHTVNTRLYYLFSCEDCKNPFPTNQDYLKHKRARPKNAVRCKYCGERFDVTCQYRCHILKVHPNKESLVKCTICNISIEKWSLLRTHMATAHSDANSSSDRHKRKSERTSELPSPRRSLSRSCKSSSNKDNNNFVMKLEASDGSEESDSDTSSVGSNNSFSDSDNDKKVVIKEENRDAEFMDLQIKMEPEDV